MCLIVFAWQQNPEFPFVLAANRDEQHARPSAPMEWWSDDEHILAGRDLVAGGSWLALARNGRFAAVTNFRDGVARAAPRSRGELVSRFVGNGDNVSAHLQTIEFDHYAGFSALFKDGDRLAYASNRDTMNVSLQPGTYGLSNAALDTPWPKLVRARTALTEAVAQKTIGLDDLLDILADRTTPAEPSQTEAANNEDPSLPTDRRARSAAFVVNPNYGTRCSTAVLYRADGHVEVAERRFASSGKADGESRFVYLLE